MKEKEKNLIEYTISLLNKITWHLDDDINSEIIAEDIEQTITNLRNLIKENTNTTLRAERKYEQEIEQLRAKVKELEEKLGDPHDVWVENNNLATINNWQNSEITKLHKRLKEQPNQIVNVIKAREIVNKAVCKMIEEDMSYFCGIDGISDYFYWESKFLQKLKMESNISMQQLIDHAVKEFSGYPYGEYGWTEENIKSKILSYVEVAK